MGFYTLYTILDGGLLIKKANMKKVEPLIGVPMSSSKTLALKTAGTEWSGYVVGVWNCIPFP